MYNLDAKSKKAEQLKALLQKTTAGIKRAKLEARNKRIWKHGELIEKIGLADLDDKALIGGLLSLKDAISDDVETTISWARNGEKYLHTAAPDLKQGSPLEISFKESPPPEIKKSLRSNGFRWNGIRGVWEGRSVRENLEALISPYDGMIKEI